MLFKNPGRGNITFDNFVQACATIRALTAAFRRFDIEGRGVIQITYEQVRRKETDPCHAFYSAQLTMIMLLSSWSSSYDNALRNLIHLFYSPTLSFLYFMIRCL